MPIDYAALDRLLLPFSAAFGAVVGSFINAVVYRLPRNISLIKESRSFCPRCKAQIAWHDNVPILSYLLLLGRCRKCRGRIPPRYLIIELLTAGLFAAIYYYVRILNGPDAAAPFGRELLGWPHLAVYLLLVAGLVCAAFTDLEDYEETDEEKQAAAKRAEKLRRQDQDPEVAGGPQVYGVIPDEVTKGGLYLALPLALLFPALHWDMLRFTPWLRLDSAFDCALGALAGAGLTWGMGVFGKVLFRKEAMGGGDVKLMGMLGAMLGWKAAIMIFFIAPVFGSIFGIVALLMGKGHYVRYGPFLAVAAVIVIFYQPLASATVSGALRFEDYPGLHHYVPFFRGLEL